MNFREMTRNIFIVLLFSIPLLAQGQKTDTSKMGMKLLVMADSLNKDGTMAQMHTKASSTVETYYTNVDSVKVDVYRNDSLVGHLYSSRLHYTNVMRLPAGLYNLKASKPGYVSQTSNDIRIEEGQILYHVIVMDHEASESTNK